MSAAANGVLTQGDHISRKHPVNLIHDNHCSTTVLHYKLFENWQGALQHLAEDERVGAILFLRSVKNTLSSP